MTLDTSRIRVEVEEHARWRRTLAFEVPADVVQKEREKTLERFARRVKIPGFRKGKVPASALERYAPAILEETVERIVEEAYRSALAERAMEPISEAQIDAVEYHPDSPLTFRVSFDVQPTVELSRLGGFELRRSSAPVTDQDVAEALHRLQVENAIWREPDDEGRPREGDLVTVRLERLLQGDDSAETASPTPRALDDLGLPWARRLRLRAGSRLGNRFQFVLGEGDAVPDLEAAVRNLAVGETGDFTIEDDSAAEEARAPGRRLRITLEERRMRELPELDDAFARSLGSFGSVEALRREIRSDLEAEAVEQAEDELHARLLDLVVEANPFDVPLSMLERYLQSMLGDTSQADPEEVERARCRLRPEAESAVKRLVVVDRVAESMGLLATSQEVEMRIAEIAKLGQATPEQIRTRLQQTKRMEAVERDVTQKKVLDFLQARSKIQTIP